MSEPVAISIIIPARNEACVIGAQVERLLGMAEASAVAVEIIVVDGASNDRTEEWARKAGAKVLSCVANRGLQQNAGAAAAGAAILWFLHADARPHKRSLQLLERYRSNARIIGGNFRLSFDAPGCAPRIFEAIAAIQRLRGIYYGDSGIWVRRDVFDLLGGFAPWPLFEDYQFARDLESFARRHGKSTRCAPLPITASSRRFHRRPARVLFQWAWLQMQFQSGVAPEILARKYFDR